MENETKNYYVYKHTTPNNKVYIGITHQEPEKRWRNGNGYKSQLLFWRAIEKYGWDNIKHEILEEKLTRQEACDKEIFYIKLYNSTERSQGYNVSLGGDLGLSKPVNMYSIDCKFIKRFETVSDASFETKISNNAITNAATGCAMTAGNYIWRYDNEPIDKYPIREYSDYKLYNLINNCKIKQYNFEGELINIYKDLKEAAEITNAQEYYIFMVCNGEQNSHFGYIWRFENDNFDKYFDKFKIRNNENEVCLINYSNLKYSNLKIYQYNLDGSLNSIYKDVYSIPHISDNEIWRVIACAKRSQDTHKGYIYRFIKDEILEKNGYCQKANNTVKIKQYDMNGNYIQTYESLSIAKELTGATNIGECARGKRHHSGGYVWRYENDSFDKFTIKRKIPDKNLKYNKPIYEFDFSGKLIKRYTSLYDFPKEKQCNIAKCLNGEIKSIYGYIYSFNTIVQPYKRKITTKKIAQYDLNTKQLIKIYDSEKEARLETGASKIYECANHQRKSSGGYIWEYVSNDEKEEFKC